MFLGVSSVIIFKWISHATCKLDISTLFVYVSACSEAFLITSVLHACMQQVSPEEGIRAGQNVDEQCADVQLRNITLTLKWSGPEIDLL